VKLSKLIGALLLIYLSCIGSAWFEFRPGPQLYTGCPRRNVPDFGRVFLMLKYTDITQNSYVQSGTVMEIMAREV